MPKLGQAAQRQMRSDTGAKECLAQVRSLCVCDTAGGGKGLPEQEGKGGKKTLELQKWTRWNGMIK